MPVTNKDLEAVFSRYPTIAVPCSLGPRQSGKSYCLYLTHKLEMEPYPVLSNSRAFSRQYMGLHKSLFFTYQHPPVLSSLVRMAATIHDMQPWGPVTWLGRVSARPLGVSGGFGLSWPSSIWTPPSPFRETRTKFKCLIHPVRLSRNWKIVVIDLPQFPREIFDAFLNCHLP